MFAKRELLVGGVGGVEAPESSFLMSFVYQTAPSSAIAVSVNPVPVNEPEQSAFVGHGRYSK